MKTVSEKIHQILSEYGGAGFCVDKLSEKLDGIIQPFIDKAVKEKIKGLNGYREVERAITEREELLGRIRYANEVIAACVAQFTQCDKTTKELYILFESSAEEDLCVYAEKMGIIKRVPGKVDRFKWVKNDQ